MLTQSVDFLNLQRAVSVNANSIIERARFYLKIRKKNSSGNLYKSLANEVKVMPNSIQVFFEAESYAGVVDKGRRKGTMPPTKPIEKWIRQKPVKLRSKNGRFKPKTEANIKGAAYAMALKIKRKGIKGSNFFTDAVKDRLPQLEKDIQDNFALDVDSYVDTFFLRDKNRRIKKP